MLILESELWVFGRLVSILRCGVIFLVLIFEILLRIRGWGGYLYISRWVLFFWYMVMLKYFVSFYIYIYKLRNGFIEKYWRDRGKIKGIGDLKD